jgi:hypothetical protein
MKAKIYTLKDSNQEAHFPDGNDTVAVCWNIKQTTKSIKGEDGLTYKAEVWERQKVEPYIDFIALREYDKGDFVKDEDCPVDGGLSVNSALRISEELIRAAKYIKEMKN